MKFGSKKAFGVIWGGFEGFGPCLGISHPTHPHLGEISQKKRFFLCLPLYCQDKSGVTASKYDVCIMQIFFVVNLASAYCVDTASEGDVKDQEGVGRHMGNNLR